MDKYIAKTFFGLEDLLVDELKSTGAEDITKLNRAVEFKGTNENYISKVIFSIARSHRKYQGYKR